MDRGVQALRYRPGALVFLCRNDSQDRPESVYLGLSWCDAALFEGLRLELPVPGQILGCYWYPNLPDPTIDMPLLSDMICVAEAAARQHLQEVGVWDSPEPMDPRIASPRRWDGMRPFIPPDRDPARRVLDGDR